MPVFLYTAKHPEGAMLTERIESATLSGARYKLELQGFREIQFHTDDLGAMVDQSLEDGNPRSWPADVLSPKQELAARQGGGALREIYFAWKANSIFWIPLFIWTALALRHGRPFRVSDWIGLSLTAVFLLYFIWVVLPSVGYQKILEAGVWHRWAEMNGWIRFIRFIKAIGYVPIPDFELDFRRAWGLAAQGRLGEAIEFVRKHENGRMGQFMYLTRVSSLYEAAGDYDKMIECRRLALQHGSGAPAEKLDLAVGLLRRKRNAPEARRILDELQEIEGGDLMKVFVLYAEGLLAVEESRWDAAATRLQGAIEAAAPYLANVLVSGMMSEVKAYLSIALANLGQYDEARSLLQEAEPLLSVRKETDLLCRCKAALPRA